MVLYRAAAGNCATAPTASASGNAWVIKTIALYTGDTEEVVQCGNLVDSTGGMQIDGPTAVCFGTNGWPTAVAAGSTGAGVACDAPAAPSYTIAFPVSATGGDRSLQVSVGLGGTVRMCDTTKTYSTTNPDGC